MMGVIKEKDGRGGGERYWREHVESWRKSGLTQTSYARQAGISFRTLGCWKRKFERAQSLCASQPQVIPVPRSLLSRHMSAEAVRAPHAGAFLLHLGVYELEIPSDFTSPALVRLLDCLERRQ
jgi:hypothetical protein